MWRHIVDGDVTERDRKDEVLSKRTSTLHDAFVILMERLTSLIAVSVDGDLLDVFNRRLGFICEPRAKLTEHCVLDRAEGKCKELGFDLIGNNHSVYYGVGSVPRGRVQINRILVVDQINNGGLEFLFGEC